MARKNWISAVAASAALMMTSPLMAADSASGAAGNSGLAGASSAASAGTVVAKKKPAKYCFATEATGSRIPKRVCQSSEAWASEGIDVKREMKKR